MDPITQQIALASAGASAAGDPVYVDDVFSTYLYEGNSSTQTITNGIDLSGEGGLTWIKCRTISDLHYWYDTERGATKSLHSEATYTEQTRTNTLTSFNSNGFSLGTDGDTNFSGRDYVSWTFRKAPGFFDVVTWTGDGTDPRALSHNLGSTPGFIAIKATSTTGNWICWHKDLSASYSVLLNSNNAQQGYSRISNIGASSFSVRDISSFIGSTNASGVSYVAYLFADNDQSFGTNSDEAIIKCGSYTGNASSGPSVDLGFEPQWLLIKNISSSSSYSNWHVYDMMRGVVTGGNDVALAANRADNESSTYTNSSSGKDHIEFTSTGFKPTNIGYTVTNATGDTYIYIAIRRPHKPPSAGTDVFAAQDGRSASDGSASQSTYTSGFPVDLIMRHTKSTDSTRTVVFDRLRGENYLLTHSSAIEASGNFILFDDMDGVYRSSVSANTGLFAHMFKRAPGFFDAVAYTGTSFARTQNHNLAAVPELIIVKASDASTGWYVYAAPLGNSSSLRLDVDEGASTSSGAWNNTSPTSSVFSLPGFGYNNNHSGVNYIAYLFATLPGISKVGSYTGTGTDGINVDCGFTGGARFVLIKRTDGPAVSGNGAWFVWDSSQGIVSGNDPYIRLNVTNGQDTTTDYIDPLNAGFIVNGSTAAQINASGGSYLFLAIA